MNKTQLRVIFSDINISTHIGLRPRCVDVARDSENVTQWPVLSSSERFCLSRSGAGPVLWAGHWGQWGSGRQPSSVSRTRREGEPAIQPAGAWSDSVKWGDRQRRQGYYKWPTHRHRAEHHASWDTVWKTQGQGEAQGGGQGEQDPHRWGQIWHEGCLGNVSTSHQDLINAIVMAANRVLAGTWQHINTCTAAKSVINMHIWTPCKSLQFALRLSLCTALLVSIIVKRKVKGPSWWLTPWLLKLLTSCFWRKLTAMPTLLTAPGQSAPGPGYVGSRIPRFLFFFWKTITGFCLS